MFKDDVEFLLDMSIFYRNYHFDTVVQVPFHQVGRADEVQRVTSVVEPVNTGMLEGNGR